VAITRLKHDALIYDSDQGFVDRMAPFVQAGLAEGAAVLAVTTPANWTGLREALGPDAAGVSFTDRDSFYVRPAHSIAEYDATVGERLGAGATSVWVIGEVQFGPTPREWDEWIAYEAIVNRAFAHRAAWIVCPYDARVLPHRVIEHARRTHPEILNGGRSKSVAYDHPEQIVRALAPEHDALPDLRPLPPADSPQGIREQLAAEMAAAGVSAARALNMLLAAQEIVSNTWRHAGGPQMLRVGEVGGRFVCEISDSGGGYDDPLAGWIPPLPDQKGGTGLWVARQVVSRMDLMSTPRGLTVRLWL
jgi:anti-sigma regulatory factor (Ser/Thr protein kinase)